MARPRTGTIYQDKDELFWVRYSYSTDGQRHTVRRRVPENTITHARKLLKKLLDEHARRGRPAATPWRFDELAKWYSSTYAVPAVYSGETRVAGLRSWRSVRYRADLLTSFFGRVALDTLTYSRIEAYKSARLSGRLRHAKSKLTEDVSLTSVNRELEVLRRMLNLAVRERWLERSPFNDGDRLVQKTGEVHRQHALTFEEEAKLLGACDARTAGLVQFAIEAGLRRGEIFKLQWANVDVETRRIVVVKMTTKNATERTVMMTDTAARVLESINRSTEFVFPGAQAIYKQFQAARVRAGLSHIRFHDLRHTFCTRLIEAGMPAEQVARISGHTQMVTFYRYVNVNQDHLNQAAEAMERLRARGLK